MRTFHPISQEPLAIEVAPSSTFPRHKDPLLHPKKTLPSGSIPAQHGTWKESLSPALDVPCLTLVFTLCFGSCVPQETQSLSSRTVNKSIPLHLILVLMMISCLKMSVTFFPHNQNISLGPNLLKPGSKSRKLFADSYVTLTLKKTFSTPFEIT